MFRDETGHVETDSLAACRIAVLTLGEDNRVRGTGTRKPVKWRAGNLNTHHHPGRDSRRPPLLRFLFHMDSLAVLACWGEMGSVP